MGTSGKDRQAALAARRRAVGLVRVPVWVRADRKSELLDFAATLTEPAPPQPSPLIPHHDPRQLDIEDAIRATTTTTTAETEGQVITATTTDRARFGAAVRAARLALGYRHVKDFAPVVDLSRSTLNNIEVGRFGASPATRARLIEALSLSEPI